MNLFLKQAFDAGLEQAYKEAGILSGAKKLWDIGKGAWGTMPEVGKQMAGFGLFGGGINAAIGDPEQSVARRFGTGFAGGAAGGLGWYGGGKAVRGLTGMAARSQVAQKYAPNVANRLSQAAGGAGKAPLKFFDTKIKDKIITPGIWSKFKTPGSRVEALKQFGGYSAAGVPAVAGAWWLSGKADEAVQNRLAPRGTGYAGAGQYAPAVAATNRFMLPLEPGQNPYGQ
jgi:hypothetical protein